MSSTFNKDPLEAFRRDAWPFRHDEFDLWPAHMRPPMHMRSSHLAFGPLMLPLAMASTVASTAIGAAGQMQAGQNAEAMGRYQNLEYQQQAETATATGQRSMLEERRKVGLVQSTLQARAAGDGGTATAPSTLNVSGQIAKRGEYNALMDLSQGENQAAGLTNMGSAAKYGGQIANEGDMYSAAGTIAGGAGSLAQTYMYGTGKLPQYAGLSNPLLTG